MRKPFQIIFLFLLFFLIAPGCKRKTFELKVITFNIRYDNPDDGINAWPSRISLVEKYLLASKPDIIGFQEALHHQVEDLEALLPGYQRVGSGRLDGKQGGEYTPIYFKNSVFELSDQGQFWLSSTPEIPGSIGEGAVLPRIATWIRLFHKPSQTSLFVFNTHYSHVSDKARKLSAEIMSEKMQQIAGNAPLILMGDFNIEYLSSTYQQVSQLFLKNNHLKNASEIFMYEPAETEVTYQGFSENAHGEFIDYIFVNEYFTVIDYSIDKILEDSIFISDHWPVKTLLRTTD